MGVLDYQFSKVDIPKIGADAPEFSGLFPDYKEPGGGYAQFAGDGYLDTQELFSYTENTDFSVSAWLKSDDPSANYALAQAHTVGTYTSDWIFVGGSALFWVRGKTMGSSALMNDNKWHHLVLVWDVTAKTYSCYFDGVKLGTSVAIFDAGAITPIIIGARGDKNSAFWIGGIAQVKVYKRQLSENEVQRLYQHLPVINGMYLYYPLVSDGRDYAQTRKHGIVNNIEFLRGF